MNFSATAELRSESAQTGRSPISFWIRFLLLVTLCASAYAQDLSGLQQGIQPYGAYHGGDIDLVSMVNGNLSLHIPLISYPQRGGKLKFSFSVVYKNQVLQPWATCNPVNHNCTSEGYNVPLSGVQIVADDVPTFSNVPDAATGLQAVYYNVLESDNTLHKTSQVDLSPSYYMSVDTSGYRFEPNSTSSTDSTGTLWDRYGTLYSMSGWQATTIVDSNGNKMTSTANAQGNTTSWTDTVGRVLPLYAYSGTTTTSGCLGSQPTTTALAWSPPGINGGTAPFKVCEASFPISFTAPGCTGNCQPTVGHMIAIQSIVLPNNTVWVFEYDSTGALIQITFPTLGTISYAWTFTSGACVGPQLTALGNGISNLWPLGRAVTSRTVNANDNTGSHIWTYNLTPTYSGTSGANVQTIVTDPLSNDAVHSETAQAGCNCSLYETELDEYSGSHTSGTLLKKTVTAYSGMSLSFPNSAYSPYNLPLAANVVPTSITYTNSKSGKVSQVTKTYDPGVPIGGSGSVNIIFGDLTTQNEYDFGQGAPGNLLRQTNNAYMAYTGQNAYNQSASNYLWNNMLSLPYSAQVKSASSQLSYVFYGYDESGLQTSNITEQKTQNIAYPGNQTSIHKWLSGSTVATTNCNVSVSNGYLVSSKLFYDTGEVQKSTDPCGYPTTYGYSSTYYGSLPTAVTNALNQTSNVAYDFDTGAMTSIEDQNSQFTTKTYDEMVRLTQVSYPDGGSTKYCYTDGSASACGESGGPYQVVVTNAIAAPATNVISTAVVDGLGRLSQTQLDSDPSGTAYSETTYDPVGRKASVYNPTRCSSITSNCGETTWGFTTTNYDALSRVLSVTEQDGSVSSTTYDQAHAGNTGVCATATDEAGNSRQSCADGLGRVTGVWEDPSHSNYETDYTYDALGNLLSVNQKGSPGGTARVRSFGYDSLSELTSAGNPESGTIAYTYDADGNVVTKTAPSPNQPTGGGATVVTTYKYDKLNRLISKSYVDSYGNPTTAGASYGYDGVALTGCNTTPPSLTDSYPVGRRTAMCDGSGATSWSHDQMGRALSEKRNIDGQTQTTSYTYFLEGSLKTVTYPGTSNVITYTMGGDDRATTAKDTVNNYVQAASYAPPGELAGMTNGASISVSNAYNSRLQPILLSATGASGSVFSECFDFHSGVAITGPSPCNFSKNTTGDNGNVYQIVNNRDNTRTQIFTYDYLNRIASAQSSGTQWGETYTIDAWGNLTNETGITGKVHSEGLNTSALSNNQLTGFSYDTAGDMINNGSALKYDAENRLVFTGSTNYYYDGDGNRVAKTSGSTGTLYWRGPTGDPLSESSLAGVSQEEYIFLGGTRIARRDVSGDVVHYYFSDHLGSHGVVENATGSTCEQDIDYYPFGAVSNDYCPSVTQHYRFTGKERDSESGLDNFGKRYFGSSLGRFMTPDPPLMDQHIADPQSWNLYSYVRNNPLSFVDPTGNSIELLGDEDQRKKELAFLQKSLGNDKAASNLYINEVKDGDKTRYFVGIKGDVGDFMKNGETSHDLANLVQNKNVVEFGVTSKDLSNQGGAVTYEKGEVGNQNVRVLVNPDEASVANRVLDPNTILGATRWGGQNQDPRWRVNPFTGEVMAWHEFGHAWGNINGRPLDHTNPEADAWENRMREQLYGPLGPNNAPRIAH
jgi:RHS repeat-associated protein